MESGVELLKLLDRCGVAGVVEDCDGDESVAVELVVEAASEFEGAPDVGVISAGESCMIASEDVGVGTV